MAPSQQGVIGRTPSGGRQKQFRGKRKFELASVPSNTKIGKEKINASRTKFDGRKSVVLVAEIANVFDPKAKKFSQAKIKTVLECPANRHFIRRNIIVKGTVIDTELGKARVTSRPGQHGTVNAILL